MLMMAKSGGRFAVIIVPAIALAEISLRKIVVMMKIFLIFTSEFYWRESPATIADLAEASLLPHAGRNGYWLVK